MTAQSFEEIAPGLGLGEGRPANWYDLADFPLVILVGVTGVGKSTTVDAMAESFQFTLLPNRRALTDRLIIAPMQAADGVPIEPVQDREQRFTYTRRYRAEHPGGMAHALAGLSVDVERHQDLLLFDGLRGVNEVSHAARALPSALFVLLEAPDVTRVERLLRRNDAFDQVDADHERPESDRGLTSFAELGLAEASEIFGKAEEAHLMVLVNQGEVNAADLVGKLRIVIEERRNYDPAATRAALIDLAPTRTLAIDTTQHSPAEAAKRIARLF